MRVTGVGALRCMNNAHNLIDVITSIKSMECIY